MPFLIRFYIIISLTCLSTLSCTRKSVKKTSSWQTINSDLSVLKQDKLILYKTALKNYSPEILVNNKEKLSSLEINDENIILAINANFFDENSHALGLLINDSKLIKKIHRGGSVLTGLFLYRDNSMLISDRNPTLLKDTITGFQSGPRLIVNNKKLKIKNPKSTTYRSGVCIDKKQNLIIYTTKNLTTATLPEVQETLLSPNIDCKNALNLDGGDSTQIRVKAKKENGEYFEFNNYNNTKVPVLFILRKKPAVKFIP